MFSCTYCKWGVDTLLSASQHYSFYNFCFIPLLPLCLHSTSHTHKISSLSLCCNYQLQCSIGCITSVASATIYIYVYLVCCVCFMCAYYNLCLMNHYSTLFSSFGFNREIELASLAFRHRLELVTYDLHLLLFALTYSL